MTETDSGAPTPVPSPPPATAVLKNPFSIINCRPQIIQEVRKNITPSSHPAFEAIDQLTMPSFTHYCSRPPCSGTFTCRSVTREIDNYLDDYNITYSCPCNNTACAKFDFCSGEGLFTVRIWPGTPEYSHTIFSHGRDHHYDQPNSHLHLPRHNLRVHDHQQRSSQIRRDTAGVSTATGGNRSIDLGGRHSTPSSNRTLRSITKKRYL